MIIAFDTVSRQIATIDGVAVVGVPVPDPVILTSHPYPIEVIETLNAGGSALGGWLLPNPVVPINMAATLVSGELTVVIAFQTYTAPTERLDTGATLVSGELTVVIAFQTYNAPDERLDVGATLQSGYLDITVSHSNPPENLDVGATLTGGTLT